MTNPQAVSVDQGMYVGKKVPPDFFAAPTARAMPAALVDAIPDLTVNRVGTTDTAYMRTEGFLGHCEPGETYRVTIDDGFTPAAGEPEPLSGPVVPPHLVLDGDWDENVDFVRDEVNILGGNGRYTLRDGATSIVLPVAEPTPGHLAFYNSALVKSGALVRFEATDILPVTVTSVGTDYPENYLLREDFGGGAYLEIHDRPHFHMPMDRSCGGYMILGKQDADGTRRVSAFRIPFGYGLHMGPWAIHNDAYITGRHIVIYSKTTEFSSVILRDENAALATIEFGA